LFLQDTFVRAKAWVKELQRQASPNIVIALAGNKSDLADKRLVEAEVCSFMFNAATVSELNTKNRITPGKANQN